MGKSEFDFLRYTKLRDRCFVPQIFMKYDHIKSFVIKCDVEISRAITFSKLNQDFNYCKKLYNFNNSIMSLYVCEEIVLKVNQDF